MHTPHIDPHHIKDIPRPLINRFDKTRDGVFERFPLLFTLLGTFGLVATFYGFEGIIDNIDLLANQPLILLGVGIATLILSGTLYKKLG